MLVWIRWSVREVISYFDMDESRFAWICSNLFTDMELAKLIKADIRRAYCLYIAGIHGKTKYIRTKVVEPELIVRISLYLRIPVPLDVLAAYEGRAKIVS